MKTIAAKPYPLLQKNQVKSRLEPAQWPSAKMPNKPARPVQQGLNPHACSAYFAGTSAQNSFAIPLKKLLESRPSAAATLRHEYVAPGYSGVKNHHPGLLLPRLSDNSYAPPGKLNAAGKFCRGERPAHCPGLE